MDGTELFNLFSSVIKVSAFFQISFNNFLFTSKCWHRSVSDFFRFCIAYLQALIVRFRYPFAGGSWKMLPRNVGHYFANNACQNICFVNISTVSSIHPCANGRRWINQSERALCFRYVIIQVLLMHINKKATGDFDLERVTPAKSSIVSYDGGNIPVLGMVKL